MLDVELGVLEEVVVGEAAGLARHRAGGQQAKLEIAIGHGEVPRRAVQVIVVVSGAGVIPGRVPREMPPIAPLTECLSLGLSTLSSAGPATVGLCAALFFRPRTNSQDRMDHSQVGRPKLTQS